MPSHKSDYECFILVVRLVIHLDNFYVTVILLPAVLVKHNLCFGAHCPSWQQKRYGGLPCSISSTTLTCLHTEGYYYPHLYYMRFSQKFKIFSSSHIVYQNNIRPAINLWFKIICPQYAPYNPHNAKRLSAAGKQRPCSHLCTAFISYSGCFPISFPNTPLLLLSN